MKVGDLVKRTQWTNIEYSPTEAKHSLGIIVSYKDERGIPGGARIGVVFSDGKRYVYPHHLEVISESR
jgi:hypothetical protein